MATERAFPAPVHRALIAAAILLAAVPADAASLLDILIPHGKSTAHHARSRMPAPQRPARRSARPSAVPPLPEGNPHRPASSVPIPDDKPAPPASAGFDSPWPDGAIADLGIVIGPVAPATVAAIEVAAATGPLVAPNERHPAEPPLPEPKPAAPPPEPRPDQPDAAAIAACRAGLAALDVVAEAEPPHFEGACGAADPSMVTKLEAGAIEVSPPAEVDCAVATALAKWIREDVQPAARATYGAPLTRLRIAGAYACRSRNHVDGAALSEHAFMNAIDIAGYDIGGRTITIADGPARTPIDAAFLDQVRKAACARFTTVLGPGTDAAHVDNLHLDTIRRGRNGDARICQ